MWSQLSLVTDAELGQLEPEAVAAGSPWGAVTWTSARTEAKRDLKIWLERDFAKQVGLGDANRRLNRINLALPAITDRILDRWSPDWVFRYTSASFTDITSAARDDNEKDIDLAAALATFGTDRIYIGALWEFEGLEIKLLDAVNAIASVLTAKYWGNNQWTSLAATDGTLSSGKTLAQSGRVTWTLPADWERRRLNGTAEEFYWVELSISAALTGGTAASQLLPIRAPDGLKRVAAYLALAHVFRGLAAQAAEPESWLTRVSNEQETGYQDRAEKLYADLRDNGGIPIDLNLNEVIEPQERAVTAPLRMYRG